MAKGNSKRKREESSSEDGETHHKKKVTKKSMGGLSTNFNNVNRQQQSHSLSASDSDDFASPSSEMDHKKSHHQKKISRKSIEGYNMTPENNNHKEYLLTSSESEAHSSETKKKHKSVDKIKDKSILKLNGNMTDYVKASEITNGSKENVETTQLSKSGSEDEDVSNAQNDFQDDVESSESGLEQTTTNREKLKNNLVSLKSQSKPGVDSKHNEKSITEYQFTKEDEEEISKFSVLLNENLAEENNIWIMQCPTNLDCKGLIGEYLDLEGSCELSDGKSDYETFSYRNPETRISTLAIPSERNQLRVSRLPIIGNIIVEESIKIGSNKSCGIEESSQCVEFPENLKIRHPLLGTNFENQPKTTVRLKKSPKKKKHSKHDSDVDATTEHNNELSMSSSQSETPKKRKKKKHKKDDDLEDTTEDNELNMSFSSHTDTPTKKTKKKHKKDKELEDSVTSIEEQVTEEPEDSVIKKKKKKKHNHQDE